MFSIKMYFCKAQQTIIKTMIWNVIWSKSFNLKILQSALLKSMFRPIMKVYCFKVHLNKLYLINII